MLRSAARLLVQHPVGTDLQRLQPLVHLGETLFCRAGRGPATLVTARGRAHPLGPLCPLRVLLAHSARTNSERMRDHLIAELHVRKAVAAIDPLVFFIDVLTPRIQSRDTGSETHTPGDASGGAVRSRPPSKAPIQIQAVLEELPHPRLPSPSIWLLGRVWMLATTATPSNALHIRYQGESLAMTGEYLSVKALTEEWEDESSHYLSAAASELCDGLPDAPSPRLVKAREQVLRAGVVTEGDLLFIASDPPRVGHLIPNHHNNTLGCRVNRDLALTAALHLPPQSLDKAELAVYRRTTADHWVLQSLPHGLCLGSRPALESASAPVDAGVDLLAFLRFGAFRIAANGRFHEHDGREE